MEPGECSGAKPVEELWAKLVPSDSRYLNVEIRSNEMVVCSEVTGASLHKHEWCKLTRNPDLCTATMQNLSPNAIIVDDIVVEKEMTVGIKSGSEIILGKDSEGCLSYTFTITPTDEQCKKLKISIDVEHAKCSICLNIWHDVVTVAPCLHNFCNGCFSEWLRRSQEKHSSVLCPQCRATVQFVGRNHFLHNIEEDILRSDPSFNRSNEEVAVLNAYASIQSNLVIRACRTPRRKRTYSPPDEDSTSVEFLCPQCGTEYGGFQCSQATVHLQCHSCEGMMPSRTDISVPQHCIGCDRAFCGPYWQSQGLVGSHLALCTRENFKPISERTTSRIPFSTHQNNLYEQDITERCIRQTGKTLQDVLSDWIAKLNNREIDRTRMPLNHAEMINAGTHLCNDCYDKLVSYLLYWFRISFPKYLLPPDASKREDCWYGSACRTQHHNEEHARKRNHVCRPTRGGNM